MKLKKSFAAVVLASLFVTLNAQAEVVTKEISYHDNGTVMKGLLAYDNSTDVKRPAVLVVHEWWGHNEYARKRAKMLAKLGYTAFAVDMYGDGKTAEHPQDASKFSNAVGGDLELAKARFEAAIDTLKHQDSVDDNKIAAIGYCFGGGIALQMARMGVDLDGVVSYHGSLGTETPAKKGDIKASIRVFNGADDPFVKPEQIEAFKKEMKNAGVDFKFENYPGAKHSFTNPGATAVGKKFNLPLEYNAAADRDSWQQTQAFFKAIFAD